MRTAVVIVHYGNADEVRRCLHSVAECGLRPEQTIVVDNPGPDSEPDKLIATYPDITVIRPDENLGYAGGANAGLRQAIDKGFEFALVLNHDVQLLPECAAELEAVFDADTTVGVAGAIPCYANTGAPHFARATINFMSGKPAIEGYEPGIDAPPYATDFATGCSIAFRLEALEKVGLFDERYFLYWEDVDLCFRMRDAGFVVVMVPTARVRHAISAATGHGSPLSIYYQSRNRLRFLSDHTQGPLRRRALITKIVISRYLMGIGRTVSGRKAIGKAYRDGIGDYLAGRGGIRAEYHRQ